MSFDPNQSLSIRLNRNFPLYSIKTGGLIDWLRRGDLAKVVGSYGFQSKGLALKAKIITGKLKGNYGVVYYKDSDHGHYFNFEQKYLITDIRSGEILSALSKDNPFILEYLESSNPIFQNPVKKYRSLASPIIKNACDILNHEISSRSSSQFHMLRSCRSSILKRITEDSLIPLLKVEKKFCRRPGKCSYIKTTPKIAGKIVSKEKRRNIKEKIIQNMFLKLNKKEQRFIALSLTGEGEAAIFQDKYEMIGPMLTLDNRSRYAQEKRGIIDFNPLDAAVQAWAYSYWISRYSDWIILLQELPHRKNDRDRSILAFMHYEANKARFKKRYSNVFHYHNNRVRPKWRDRSKRIKIKEVSKKNRKLKHIYYRGIAWEPSFHEAKKSISD